MNVRSKESSLSNTEIIVRSLKQPTVTDVKIKDGLVELMVEKELGVELLGDSKVKVMAEDDFEDWDEIEEDVPEEEIDNVEEEYIKEDNENKE